MCPADAILEVTGSILDTPMERQLFLQVVKVWQGRDLPIENLMIWPDLANKDKISAICEQHQSFKNTKRPIPLKTLAQFMRRAYIWESKLFVYYCFGGLFFTIYSLICYTELYNCKVPKNLSLDEAFPGDDASITSPVKATPFPQPAPAPPPTSTSPPAPEKSPIVSIHTPSQQL